MDLNTMNTLSKTTSNQDTPDKTYKTISTQFEGVAVTTSFSYPILKDWNVSEVTKTNNEYHFSYTSSKNPTDIVSIKVVHTNEAGPMVSAAIDANKNNVAYRYLYDPHTKGSKTYPGVTNFLDFKIGFTLKKLKDTIKIENSEAQQKGSIRIYFNAEESTFPLMELYSSIIDSFKISNSK